MRPRFDKSLPVFQTINAYPFLQPLKDHWQEIRDEMYAYRNSMDLCYRRDYHNDLWKLTFLVHHGKWNSVADQFPITSQLVKNVPGLYIVAFSVLEPGCVISPHRGYTQDVWRSHLGLSCPDGAWINVAGEQYKWKDGEMVVFDDMRKHHAANESSQERAILMVDFRKTAV